MCPQVWLGPLGAAAGAASFRPSGPAQWILAVSGWRLGKLTDTRKKEGPNAQSQTDSTRRWL